MSGRELFSKKFNFPITFLYLNGHSYEGSCSSLLSNKHLLGEGEKPPPGWSKSSGHIIFDVKMDFTRKARWVKDGHKTPEPEWSTYAGFVSRDSVRIALTYAALNGLIVYSGRYSKCLSTGSIFRKALHHLWRGIRPRKCRKSCFN